MAYDDRKPLMEAIERLRGRTLLAFMNFDRPSIPPNIPGLMTQFHNDVKEATFRILKESLKTGGKIDVFLYTRGGNIDAVWPLVSLLREFDADFEVLIPFRCHSAGTLVALGARRITMGPISELSPIDPSTGNQFNPTDASNQRLAISVEDVRSYKEFVSSQFDRDGGISDELLAGFVDRLATVVHPLALGNVHRVYQQIKQLASNLLSLHPIEGRDVNSIITELTTKFYSHLHMINRHEARRILGEGHVAFASEDVAAAMDALLGAYKRDFALHKPFVLATHLGDKQETEARFIGGLAETKSWSYLFETKVRLRQQSKFPPNVQLQLNPTQAIPLFPGLPREYNIDVTAQGWVRNTEPKGVTT